jgi:hypothetical protein
MAKTTTSEALLQAIAVTAELTGTDLSKAAARVFAADLSGYPEEQVLAALRRVRHEVRGRMTVADVVTRLEDGRPSADEAWAMIPSDERQTVVWTEEMAAAYGVVAKLMAARNMRDAGYAFRTAYDGFVKKSREAHVSVKWFPSIGSDPDMRAAALEEAVRKRRITPTAAAKHLPSVEASPEIAALLVPLTARLTTVKE